MEGIWMKTLKSISENKVKIGILVGLLVVGLIFRKSYLVSNIYFVAGMLMLFAGIISILFNAHLFSGWKLNVNRKNSEFVDDVEGTKKLSKKELAKKVAAQKNAPLKFSLVTRTFLSYALILIISSILVSYF
ncbi:hypothetical protein IV81_GL000315 [Pediococcus stilesii]|uniref:DUF3899 domain-containing protein n=2 Tax=Pediococcus stilesii TaxID=331679 RepID=A0A0R2L3B8_9LACO|nr:hypothetical protein IV81_GL000315 [Pediococcus stilesii]